MRAALPRWLLSRFRKAPRESNTQIDMREVFSTIYRDNLWADPESFSGRGSTLARTGVIRMELPRLLHDAGAKTLLDAACGDFNWMRHLELGSVQYIGVDIVPELIAQNQEKFGCERRRF